MAPLKEALLARLTVCTQSWAWRATESRIDAPGVLEKTLKPIGIPEDSIKEYERESWTFESRVTWGLMTGRVFLQ